MNFTQLSDTIPIEFGKEFISFVTGNSTEDRISLKYYHNPTTGAVYADVRFGQLAQGPPGHAHGGAISAVFDELMGACCWVNRLPALTAQYTTRFFKPVPLDIQFIFCTGVTHRDGNKITLKAALKDGEGNKYAEAKGLFIMQDIATFKKMAEVNPAYTPHFESFDNL